MNLFTVWLLSYSTTKTNIPTNIKHREDNQHKNIRQMSQHASESIYIYISVWTNKQEVATSWPLIGYRDQRKLLLVQINQFQIL